MKPVLGAAVLVTAALARWRYLRWAATTDELNIRLPGDDLMAAANISAARGITIHVAAAAIWPWKGQMGQGRGGLYSYDALENLAGCDIDSADRIVPEWQQVEVGTEIRLAPTVRAGSRRHDPAGGPRAIRIPAALGGAVGRAGGGHRFLDDPKDATRDQRAR